MKRFYFIHPESNSAFFLDCSEEEAQRQVDAELALEVVTEEEYKKACKEYGLCTGL